MRRHDLLLLLLLVLIFGLAAGYRLGDFQALMTPQGHIEDLRWLVLSDIRLPRMSLAVLTGASLALAGHAMQGVFQNPLASPGLLGSSSGATTVTVFLLYYFALPTSWLLLGGMLGALGAFLLVWLMARRHGSTMMILSGVAINVLLGTMVTLLLSNADSPWALAELYRWLQGSLMWATAEALFWSLPLVGLGILCLFSQRRYIDVLSFGEETAMTMGVDIARSFLVVCIGVALLVGATIPQTGTIGFIGLIAPHLARRWQPQAPSQGYLTSALIGALLLLVADLALQYVPWFSRLYIGTLTALLGVPFLVWILLTQQRHLAR